MDELNYDAHFKLTTREEVAKAFVNLAKLERQYFLDASPHALDPTSPMGMHRTRLGKISLHRFMESVAYGDGDEGKLSAFTVVKAFESCAELDARSEKKLKALFTREPLGFQSTSLN
jgi:hypothetical protein